MSDIIFILSGVCFGVASTIIILTTIFYIWSNKDD